jgi:hypothetical protein
MTIDLDGIESRINDGIYGDDRMTNTGRDDAFSALAVLLAEVERLREVNDGYLLEIGRQHALLRDQKRGENAERAAVVAWLRAEAYLTLYDDKPDDIADRIERGDHRREET